MLNDIILSPHELRHPVFDVNRPVVEGIGPAPARRWWDFGRLTDKNGVRAPMSH